jgi:hypothetical protein
MFDSSGSPTEKTGVVINWILINEIPIETRKITGETTDLKRKYFTRSGCISLSTKYLL